MTDDPNRATETLLLHEEFSVWLKKMGRPSPWQAWLAGRQSAPGSVASPTDAEAAFEARFGTRPSDSFRQGWLDGHAQVLTTALAAFREGAAWAAKPPEPIRRKAPGIVFDGRGDYETAEREPKPPSPAPADGWVMVPREPTEEMLAVNAPRQDIALDMWRDMITAAPKGPGVDQADHHQAAEAVAETKKP